MLLSVGRLSVTAGLIVLLAACAGQSMTAGAPPVLQYGTNALRSSPASRQDLLYISSVGKSGPDVFIYGYPNGPYKRKVDKSALMVPLGECSDKKGHVYVTNQASSSSSTAILEYVHGGTKPIRTLTVDGSADQCSIDRKSGDLAVISSQLAIFRAAKGRPSYYRFPSGFQRAAGDYDNKGNLFVNGVTKASPTRAALIELPAGSSSFVKISLPDIFEANVPGDVRWDGKDLALGDGASSIFRLAISGKKAQEVGIVQLYGGAHVHSICIQDGDIVGANSTARSVMIWSYPGGGQPLKVFNRVGRGDGVAVSVAPQT